MASTQKSPSVKFELNAYAEQQVFAVEGEKWKTIAQADDPLSEAFLGVKVPDQQIVTFPYRCSATEEQVRI